MISCIMSISKILTNLCAITQNIKTKSTFADIVFFFISKKMLVMHKEVCLKINGKQSVKLRNGFIRFNN